MLVFGDYQDFALVISAVFFIPMILFFRMKYLHPEIPGLGLFSLGYLIFFLANLIRTLDLGLDIEVKSFIINCLIAVLYCLITSGFKKIIGLKSGWKFEVGLLIFFIQVSFIYLFLENTYETRVTLISSTIASYSALMFFYSFKGQLNSSFLTFSMKIGVFVNFLISSARSLYSFGVEIPIGISFQEIDSVFMLWSIVYAVGLSGSLYSIAFQKISFGERTHINVEDGVDTDKVVLAAWKRIIHGYVMQDLREAVSSSLKEIEDGYRGPSTNREHSLNYIKSELASSVNILDEINDFVSVLDLLDEPVFAKASLRRLSDELSLKWSIPVARQKATKNTYLNIDEHLFFIAMGNVIANGLRHAKSFCRVDVAVDEGWAVFDIVDDGPGLPNYELDAVWSAGDNNLSPFSRMHGALGLGLLITQAVVAVHGGRAIVFSQQPSILRLALPVLEESDPDQAPPDHPRE